MTDLRNPGGGGLDQDETVKVLREKVEQLALSSRYKSQFLAVLSHELRTPLNSLLILGRLLAENASGNLTPKQVEYAQTICMAGDDLLELTNEILDLARVESGAVTVNLVDARLADLGENVERAFRQIARDKGLQFRVAMQEGLPATIRTDPKRLRQILHNLLSNAFKFTQKGTVSFEVALADQGSMRRRTDAVPVLKFSVADTGIGVAKNKLQAIFEPFRQADGTTDRRFGGTGLGLAISADLARLLGGEIRVESSPGEGSTFTFFLPLGHEAGAQAAPASDDRAGIRPGDRAVLVVADDAGLAAAYLEQVRALGFKALSAANTHTALALASEYNPSAVIVGIKSQAAHGWASFNLLHEDPETRQVPVSVACADEEEQTFASMAALGFARGRARHQALLEALRRLRQFSKQEPRAVLVASASRAERKGIASALAAEGLHVIAAATGKQALKVLGRSGTDCAVIGESLAGMRALDLLRQVFQSGCGEQLSIVMLRAADTGPGAASGEVGEVAEMLLLKRVRSAAAVLEHSALCLNEAMKAAPPAQLRPRPGARRAATPLAGTKVLIVDDEIRDIFALTSILEQQGMRVISASGGIEGIEKLKQNPDVDIILMDMRMPKQDGYQTIRLVRGLQQFRNLPVIGVTAGAMTGDREKCMAAGATDYVSKPIDVEQLLSVMRLWLADKPPAVRPGPAQSCTNPA
ncbi:MAG TPA: response regulator [Burkholderiales bacterium]